MISSRLSQSIYWRSNFPHWCSLFLLLICLWFIKVWCDQVIYLLKSRNAILEILMIFAPGLRVLWSPKSRPIFVKIWFISNVVLGSPLRNTLLIIEVRGTLTLPYRFISNNCYFSWWCIWSLVVKLILEILFSPSLSLQNFIFKSDRRAPCSMPVGLLPACTFFLWK
jgi:hypothetical protein